MIMEYNGWTNYATWRINLQVFDGMTCEMVCGRKTTDTYELSESCRELVVDAIHIQTEEGIARDYAMAFISDVNFYEIAEHLVMDEECEMADVDD